MILIIDQSKLVSFNHMWSVSPNWMHADHENLILWYLSIWQSDLRTGHIFEIVRISRSFLWYEMNDLMHEIQLWFFFFFLVEKVQLWFFGYLEWSFCHVPILNNGSKIECLQSYYISRDTLVIFIEKANLLIMRMH